MSRQDHSTNLRGDATREALLISALELFGRHGYDATSNRQLADKANVNQALIGYHFGSKRGLYLAVFEHISSRLGEQLGPSTEPLQRLLREDAEATREELLEAVLTVTDRFAVVMTSPETAPFARLIIREQQDPSDAFDVLFERSMSRLIALLAGLVARLLAAPSESPEVRLLAITLIGQAVVFRTAQAGLLRAMAWKELGPTEIAAIRQRIRRNVTAILMQEIQR